MKRVMCFLVCVMFVTSCSSLTDIISEELANEVTAVEQQVTEVKEEVVEDATEEVVAQVTANVTEQATETVVAEVEEEVVETATETLVETVEEEVVETATETLVETVEEEVVETAVEQIVESVVEEEVVETAVEQIVESVVEEEVVEAVVEEIVESVEEEVEEVIEEIMAEYFVTEISGEVSLLGFDDNTGVEIYITPQTVEEWILIGETSTTGSYSVNVHTKTNDGVEGEEELVKLPFDWYTVKFVKDGFTSYSVENVAIMSNRGTYNLDAELRSDYESTVSVNYNDQEWVETGIYLKEGDILNAVIQGNFTLGPNDFVYFGDGNVATNEKDGALVYSINDTVYAFYDSFQGDYRQQYTGSIVASQSGWLKVRVNEYEEMETRHNKVFGGQINLVFQSID